jgi:hypothetical protein
VGFFEKPEPGMARFFYTAVTILPDDAIRAYGAPEAKNLFNEIGANRTERARLVNSTLPPESNMPARLHKIVETIEGWMTTG